MIPKPKYIENILEITKYGKGFICCDVICECGSRHFICYKNVLIKSKEQKEYEKQLIKFFSKYNSFTTTTENGVRYLCGLKGIFSNKVVDKMESKSFDCTEIIKVKCAHCGKEFILFDSRFHGYDAVIPERDNKYDNVEYLFKQIKWKNDEDGIATFSIKIDNDDTLEEFINNAYETDLETYSNSFGSIIINAKNVKTNTKKTIVNLETE